MNGGKKKSAWRKIAISAAEQCQRNNLPDVLPLTEFNEVIQDGRNYDLKLIPTLEGPTLPLNEAMSDFKRGCMIVLIGPEGDFTPQEVKSALAAGFRPVTMGSQCAARSRGRRRCDRGDKVGGR